MARALARPVPGSGIIPREEPRHDLAADPAARRKTIAVGIGWAALNAIGLAAVRR
jgi:hypothetical protein